MGIFTIYAHSPDGDTATALAEFALSAHRFSRSIFRATGACHSHSSIFHSYRATSWLESTLANSVCVCVCVCTPCRRREVARSTVQHVERNLLLLVTSASDLPMRTDKLCSVLFSSAYSLMRGSLCAVNRRASQLWYITAPTAVDCESYTAAAIDR